MTEEERDAIRARCETATPGSWKQDEDDPAIVHIGDDIARLDSVNDAEFIAHARQDILALLYALGVAEKTCPNGGNDGYITPRPCQCEMKSLEAERDQWKVRAEALERAVRTISPCAVCVNQKNDRNCSLGYDAACACIFGNRKDWQFDEPRFAKI